MDYLEKEITIFEGLINLIESGENPYTITVSDIAKSANIGKGSLYDYFSSKKEIISQALVYFVESEIEIACNRIKSRETFKEKFYEILFLIVESLDRNASIIDAFLSAGSSRGFYKDLLGENYSTKYLLDKINQAMEDLLEVGYNEGVVNKDIDNFYKIMAIRGSISGFSHYVYKRKMYEGIDVDRAMDTAYTLLLRSLR